MTMDGNATKTCALEWAIVELMGHRRRAGRVEEVDRFGAKLLRLDIPVAGAFVTEFYGGGAIYALRPCTEAIARAAAESLGDPRPVMPASYRLAHQLDDADATSDPSSEEFA